MARAKKQIAKRAAARDERGSDRTVATNRRARREYEFIETLEAGIVLQGSEVKSLREGKAQLSEAYARVDDGEMWLFQMHIPPWQFATGFGAHDPDRKRKLLLHRDQIDELLGKTQQQSLTLIPVSLYFKDGRAKVQIALAKGRKLYDKRNLLMSRDARARGGPGHQGDQPLERGLKGVRRSEKPVEWAGWPPGSAGEPTWG